MPFEKMWRPAVTLMALLSLMVTAACGTGATTSAPQATATAPAPMLQTQDVYPTTNSSCRDWVAQPKPPSVAACTNVSGNDKVSLQLDKKASNSPIVDLVTDQIKGLKQYVILMVVHWQSAVVTTQVGLRFGITPAPEAGGTVLVINRALSWQLVDAKDLASGPGTISAIAVGQAPGGGSSTVLIGIEYYRGVLYCSANKTIFFQRQFQDPVGALGAMIQGPIGSGAVTIGPVLVSQIVN